MPELPEVQTTVNGINKFVKGLTIKDVWTSYNSSYHAGKDNIKDPAFFKYFKKNVLNQKITHAERRAKNVLVFLQNKKVMLFHMKMTGHLLYGDYEYHKKTNGWKAKDPKSSLANPLSRFIRLIFKLSNGKFLAFSDMRRFAKVTLIEGNHNESLHLKDTGPEPLDEDFDIKKFETRLKLKPNGKIKQVLLDPKIIAGIGNIYSDEILWRSGIHPERKIKDLQPTEFKVLFKATKETLLKGIDFGGDSMSDYRNILGEKGEFQEHHRAYRRTGKPCERKGCKGTIIRKRVGGRNAHFCNTCQR